MERGDKVRVIKTGNVHIVMAVIPAFGHANMVILDDGLGYSEAELKVVKNENA